MLIACFIAYLLILIAVAQLLSKRMSGLLDFFLAGRTLPAIAISLTFVASWFGAGSTMGSMNQAYESGLNALWLIAVPTLLTCTVVGLFFAKKVRTLDCLSLPEAIEKHYGPVGSFMLACIILAASSTLIASQLVAAGDLLQMSMGLSPLWSLTLIMLAIVIYSVIGGYRAVVMTDICQFVGFSLALVILLVFVLSQAPTLSVAHPPTFWNPFLDLKTHLSMVFTFVLAWSIAPEMWQRMSSAKTADEAQKSVLVAGLLLMGLYAAVITIGMLAVTRMPGVDPKNVLISMAMGLPSPWLTGIVLVGVLSAITSTIDSALNVSSLTFSRDLAHRFFWRNASHKQLVRLSQVVTLFIGVPAIVIALKYQDIIEILWISADIYASTIFIPIMGVFYARRTNRLSGILAMVLGACPVLLNLCQDFGLVTLPGWWPVSPYTTVLGICLGALGFLLGYYLSPSAPATPVKDTAISR